MKNITSVYVEFFRELSLFWKAQQNDNTAKFALFASIVRKNTTFFYQFMLLQFESIVFACGTSLPSKISSLLYHVNQRWDGKIEHPPARIFSIELTRIHHDKEYKIKCNTPYYEIKWRNGKKTDYDAIVFNGGLYPPCH